MEKNKKIKKGFTLVEIVIVIAVIAILAAVLLPVFSAIIENARRSKAFQEIVSVKNDYFSQLDDPTTNMQDFVFVVGDYVYGLDENGNWVIIDFDDDYTLVGVIGNVNIYEKNQIIELLEPGLYETGSETMICSWNDLIRNNLVKVSNDEITDYLVMEAGDLYVHHDIEKIQVNVFNATQNPSANYLTGISFGGDIESIQQNAFYGCQNLQFIAFRDSKASHEVRIEDFAFYGCQALELKDSLPIGLVKIGKNAFSNCNAITEVTIPNTMVNIDDLAFENCSSLEKIIIPSSVTYMDKAFINCRSLKEIVVNRNNYVYYSDGKALYKSDTLILFANMSAKEYNVLESVDLNQTQVSQISTLSTKITPRPLATSVTITNIGDSAFKGCDNLTKVILPSTLKTVQDYAFYNCSSLTNVAIPSNLQKIGTGSFQECDTITNIDLGDKVEKVGPYAFANCDNLNAVTYKDSLTAIEASAFESCQNLQSFTFTGTTNNLAVIGNYAFKNDTKLNMTSLPSNVEEIGEGSFYGCSLLKITELPTTVVSVNASAFARTGITQITLNTGLRTMGSGVFEGTNLNKVNFNAVNLTSAYEAFRDTTSTFNLVVSSKVTKINSDVFRNSKVASIVFETEINAKGDEVGIKEIANNAFINCRYLKVLDLPDTLLIIGESAFAENFNLNAVKLGKNLETINNNAFEKCYRLIEIYDTTERLSNPITLSKTNNGRIAYYALKIHTEKEAQSVIVEDSNTNFVFACVEDMCYAVNYVGTKTTVSVPQTFMYNGVEKTVNALRYTFYESDVTNVTICDTVKIIDQYSFYECNQLKNVTLSQNLERINEYAFFGCEKLAEINFPETLQEIGQFAFYGCTSLRTLTIPNSVTKIGKQAFMNCEGIEAITIGEGMSNEDCYGEDSFDNCKNLIQIFNNSDIVMNYSNEHKEKFGHVTKYALNIVNKGDGRDAIFVVGDFVYILAGNDGLVYLIKLSDNTKTDIVIPATVKINGVTYNNYIVKENAFNGNNTIKTVKIESEEKQVGDDTIICGVTRIESGAFRNCTAMTSLDIGNSVEVIESNAFAGCKGLKVAYLGKNIKTIEMKNDTSSTPAFYDCVALREIYNESGLTLEYGSDNHGNVAKYALKIYNSRNAVSEIITYKQFEFIKDRNNQIRLVGYVGLGGNVVLLSAKEIVEQLFPECEQNYTIYNSAFYDKAIQSLTFAEGCNITEIGDYAFWSCDSLSGELVIPSCVAKIGNSAFSGCGFTKITLPEELKVLSSSAFAENRNLREINFNCINISQGSYVFNYAGSNYRNTIVNIGAKVTQIPNNFLGSSNTGISQINFPDNSVCVTIGNSAFRDMNYLTQVNKIPTSITSFGTYAFSGCSRLYEIVLPDSITTISGYMFENCTNLAQITMPSSVKTIGEYAFSNCKNLVDIDLNNVELIGNYAFTKCEALSRIRIPASVTKIGNYAFKDCKKLLSADFANQSKLTILGSYAFENCSALLTINLPSGITLIDNYTFKDCVSLSNAIFENVRQLGEGAFYNCSALSYIGKEVDGKVVMTTTLTSLSSKAFFGCSSLKSIDLTNIKSLGKSVFEECVSLEEVKLPQTLTVIPEKTFKNNSSLKKIIIHNGITDIKEEAFYGCIGLLEVYNLTQSPTRLNIEKGEKTYGYVAYYAIMIYNSLDEESRIINVDQYFNFAEIDNELYLVAYTGSKTVFEDGDLVSPTKVLIDGIVKYSTYKLLGTFSRNTEIIKVTIPSYVTEIGDLTFYNCSSLENVTLVNSITKVGKSAFAYCSSLKDFKTSQGDSGFTRVTAVEERAFEGCSKLANLDFGTTIESIGDYAFTNFTNPEIKTLNLPTNLTSLGEGAFMGCVYFTTINILSENLTEISDYAFSNCSNLTTITYSDSIEKIGNYAFDGCSRLKQTQFNNTITEIGAYAFNNCSSILTLVLPTELEVIGENAFANCINLQTAVVYGKLKEIANNVFINCTGLTDITINEGVEAIGNNVFENCKSLGVNGTIVIPNSVTIIGEGVFLNCSTITSINISNAITEIPKNAFNGCESLVSMTFDEDVQSQNAENIIKIPNNVLVIGDAAFLDCDKITKVILPSKLVTIGDEAFKKCSKLSALELPNTLQTIGASAFSDCNLIESLTIPQSVTQIKEKAFYNLYNLKTLNYNAEEVADFTDEYDVFGNAGYVTENIVLNIGANVKVIPNYFFGSKTYSNLKKVTVAQNSVLQEIGEYAFYNCSNLAEFDVLNTIKIIGTGAFSNSGITTFNVPTTVMQMGQRVFENCEDLTSVTMYASIVGVPDYTFYNCSNLSAIELADNYTYIGQYAFYNCAKLETEITIGSQVQEVRKYAYYGAYSVTGINIIGASGLKIGEYAFYGNSRVTTLTLGSSIVEISTSAFANLYALTTLNYNIEQLNNFTAGNGLFVSAGQTNGMIVNIGNKVKSIPAYLFHSSTKLQSMPNIKEIKFANDSIVTSIGASAFSNLSNLTKANIPTTTKEIGSSAFANCEKLTGIDLQNVEIIGSYAFTGCKAMTNITIPETVKSIGVCAFKDCTSLTRATIYAKLSEQKCNSYQYSWFLGCNDNLIIDLKTINVLSKAQNAFGQYFYYLSESKQAQLIFANVTISESGLYRTGDLTDTLYSWADLISYGMITVEGTTLVSYDTSKWKSQGDLVIDKSITEISANAMEGNTYLTGLQIGANVTQIGESAFKNCKNITFLTIPENVTTIGNGAFYNCSKIRELSYNARLVADLEENNGTFYCMGNDQSSVQVTFGTYVEKIPANLFNPSSNSNYAAKITSLKFDDDILVSEIGSYAFARVKTLSQVTLPSRVTTIGSYAFYYATSITTFTFNSSLTTIGDYALSGISLQGATLTVPSSINVLGEGVFSNTKFQALDFGANVTKIPDYTFYNCGYFYTLNLVNSTVITEIGEFAFSGCARLSTINLSDKVTKIGANAFSNCVVLRSAEIGEKMEEIGEYAFMGSGYLQTINMPATLTELGRGAFKQCASLISIDIPNNITQINDELFSNCTNLETVTFGENLQVIGVDAFLNCSKLSQVVIPDTLTEIKDNAFKNCVALQNIDFNKVEKIGASAFSGCSAFTQIVLPNTLTQLGEYAFEKCNNVQTLTLSTGLTMIPSYAFSECSKLSVIDIPDNVEEIGQYAFANCLVASRVYLGKKLTKINDYAFINDSSLLEIYNLTNTMTITIGSQEHGYVGFYAIIIHMDRSEESSIVLDSESGFAFMQDANSVLHAIAYAGTSDTASFPTEVTLTDGTVYTQYKVKDNIFKNNTSIKSIHISSAVTSIGENVFNGATNLETVTFDEGLQTISAYTFYNCVKLQSVDIPDSVTTIGAYAFAGCSGLKTLTIGQNVTTIENNAFNNLRNLERLNYEAINCNDLETKNNVFNYMGYNNDALVVEFTSSVIRIPAYLLGYATSSSITSSGSYSYIKIKDLIIGENVQDIAATAFYDIMSIRNIYYNTSKITSLHSDGIFRTIGKTSGTINVYLNNNTKVPAYFLMNSNRYSSNATINFVSEEELTQIGTYAFYYSGLKEFTLTSSVTLIDKYAFGYTTKLSTLNYNIRDIGDFTSDNYIFQNAGSSSGIINIGANVEKIPAYFMGNQTSNMSNFAKLVFDNTITNITIGQYAFSRTKLTSATLYGITEIPNYAFANATSLITVSFPSTCVKIGNSAFEGCSKLTTIELNDEIETIGSKAFYNCSSLTEINIPTSLTEMGTYAFAGCTKLTSVTLSSNLTEIPNYAFSECSMLTKVTNMDNIVTIGDYAFYKCTVLSEIALDKSLQEIGKYAFQNCSTLTNLVIGDSLLQIKDFAFNGCYGFTTLELGKNLELIGVQAFENCLNVTSITIGEKVNKIGAKAFKGLKKLTTINYNAAEVESFTASDTVFISAGLDTAGITVTIGNKVKTIPARIFYITDTLNIPNITSIVFEENSTLNKIETYALANLTKITSLNIPASVTEISERALSGLTNLTEIYLNEGITTLGKYFLAGCVNLENLYFNCKNLNNMEARNFAFYNVGTSDIGVVLTIGKDVTRISSYAFNPYSNSNYAPKFKYVNYEEGSILTTIGSYAFAYVQLDSFTVSETIQTIETSAFYNCKSLLKVCNLSNLNIEMGAKTHGYVAHYALLVTTDPNENIDFSAQGGFIFGFINEEPYLLQCTLTDKERIVLPEYFDYTEDGETTRYTQYTIKESCFSNFVNLITLVANNSVIAMESYAFSNCTNLTTIENLSNLITIPEYAFFNCEKLLSVDLSNVLTIKDSAFRNAGITSANLSKVRTLESYAFYGCQRLEEVIWTPHINVVPEYLFTNSAIKNIEFTDNITEIKKFAFSGCSKLEEINIPDSVITIGEKAFLGCSSVKTLTLGRNLKTIEFSAFNGLTSATNIYYNAINMNDFANGNQIFANLGTTQGTTMIISDEVKHIPAYLLCPNFTATNAQIPNPVKVTSLTVGKNVETIGVSAFHGLYWLNTLNYNAINVANSTSTSYTFRSIGYNISELTLNIGTEVERIPDYMFYQNNATYFPAKVTSIIFPNNTKVTDLGNYCFGELRYVQNVYYTVANFDSFNGRNIFYYLGYNSATLEFTITSTMTKVPEYFLYEARVSSVVFQDANDIVEIGQYAFYNNQKLSSITLPVNCQIVGNRAFYNCSVLASFTFNDNLVTVGEYAFYNSGIETLIIPESIQNIGTFAFAYMSKLHTIEFNAKITTIPNATFRNNTALTSVTFNEDVKKLGDEVFRCCKALKDISFIEGITNIGNYCFAECTALQEFELYEGNVLGTYVFYGCSGLKTYTFHESITHIPNYTFYSCTGFTEVVIPETVKTVGDYAFYYCTGLQSIVIPDNVESIGQYAFQSCSNALSIDTGDGLKSIGYYAFVGCSKVTSIIIGENLQTIGRYAFADLYLVTEIYYNGNVSTMYSSTSTSNYVFNNCGVNGSGINITIGNKARQIPNFFMCPYRNSTSHTSSTLTYYTPKVLSVTFEENSICTYIGQFAFYNLDYITEITIPKSVTSWGTYAFANCSALTTLNLEEGLTSIGGYAFYYCLGLTEITIPSSVTSWGTYSFYYNTAITKINLTEGLTTLGGYAFANLTGLTEVTLPASLENWGTYTFTACTSLVTVNMTENIKAIGSYAFNGCTGIETINFKGTSTLIGSYAFNGCTKLNSVTNISAQTVDQYAFNGCTALTTVTFVDGVETIGNYAFNGCTALTTITTPSTLVTLGEYVFKNCTSLNEVTLNEGLINMVGSFREYTYGVTKITIPSTVTNYNYAFYKNTALAELTLTEGLTIVGVSTFDQCTSLKVVVIPDSVKVLDTYAFSSSRNIEELTIGRGVESIGYYAFYEMRSLRKFYYNAENATFAGNEVNNWNRFMGNTYQDLVLTIGPNVKQIPANFMYNHEPGTNGKYLTKIVFENSNKLTSIGDNAFRGLTTLTTIENMPHYIVTIGNYAFRDCSSLTEFHIPYFTESIGTEAFYNCVALKTVKNFSVYITVEPKTTTHGYVAYYADDLESGTADVYQYDGNINGFKFKVFENVVTLYAYEEPQAQTLSTGTGKEITLPRSVELDGKVYTSYLVDNEVFKGLDFTKVIIPEAVMTLGKKAFYGCTSLQEVIIEDGVGDIESECFANCSALVTVTMGKISSLGASAFQNCTSLETVVLPSTLTTIPQYAFYGCTSLTTINLDNVKIIETYSFYNTGLVTLTIPESVTRIDTRAFQNSAKLQTLVINAKAAIGTYAFYNSDALVTVNINSGVTAIQDYAFDNCSSNFTLTIAETVKNIAQYSFQSTGKINVTLSEGVTTIGYRAFYNSGVTSINIPGTLVNWGNQAFYNAKSLSNLNLENTTKLGYETFYNCTGLTEITIPASLKTWDYYSFRNCTNLVTVNLDEATALGYYTFYRCTKISSVTIPSTLTTWGSYTFTECTGITTVNLENAVKLGDYTFNGCTKISSVTIPASLITYGSGSFYNCTGITSVNLEEATTLGTTTFYGCSGITTITIPETLVNWGSYTFQYCRNLKTVNLQNSVKIGTYCFYDCDSITEIVIPNTWTEIANGAFANCNNLKDVTYGDNLTSIGNYAFENCTSIQRVVLPSKVTKVGDYAYRGNTSISYLQLNEGLTEIGNGAFSNNTSLLELILPTTVQILGNSAFSSCSKLSVIQFNDNLISIGSSAFESCTALTALEFGENLTTINSYAFRNCTGLTSVIFKDNVTTYYSYAFYNCTGLTELELSKGTKTIADYAFSNLTGLKKLVINGNGISLSMSSNSNYRYFAELVNLNELVINTSISTNSSYNKIRPFYNMGLNVYATEGLSVTTGGNCTSLGEFLFLNGNYDAITWSNYITKLTLGENLTSIGSYTLINSRYLTEVNINSVRLSALPVKYAGESAKDENDNLLGVKVTFGENVERIPSYTFAPQYLCNLNGIITYPQVSKITTIGTRAFEAFPYVEDEWMLYPDTITTIESYAFANRKELEVITIGEKVVSLGTNVYDGCTNVREINFNAINCQVVTSNATVNMFNGVGSATGDITLNIGSSVLRIPQYLFYNATASTKAPITKVNFVDTPNVKYVERYAFNGVTGIFNIIVPETVETIGEYAYAGVTGATTLTLNENITSIGAFAFKDTNNIIEVNYNIPTLASPSNDMLNGLGSKTEKSIVFNIGDNVVNIPTYFFRDKFNNGSYIKELNVPSNNSIESIGSFAFYNISKLAADFTLTNNVIYINEGAFQNCSFNIIWSDTFSIKSIGANAFNGATAMLEAYIPDSCTSVGSNAFQNSTSLKSLYIGNGITVINQSAFANLTALEELTIGKAITQINRYGFGGLVNLKKLYFNAVNSFVRYYTSATDTSYRERSEVFRDAGKNTTDGFEFIVGKDVQVIPDYLFYEYTSGRKAKIKAIKFEEDSRCYYIGTYAFYNNTTVKHLEIPEAFTSIGSSPFYYLSNVEYIEFRADNCTIDNLFSSVATNPTNVKVVITENVSNIPNNFLYNKSKVTSIEIENIKSSSLKNIDYRAFYNNKFTTFIMPDTVKTVGDQAFYGCTALADFSISQTIQTIGASAFYNCSLLYDIVIPNTCTSIGDSAFYNCQGLRLVSIGKNVTTIGTNAFYGVINLEDFIYNATNVGDSIGSAGMMAKAGTNTNGTRVTIASNVKRIPNYLCGTDSTSNVLNISNVEFEESSQCMEIGTGAFRYSYAKTCNIPDTVITIKDYAFAYTVLDETFIMPSGIQSIGSYAFYYNSGLKELEVADSCISVGSYAFAYSSIEKVTLGAGITQISSYMFYNATNLKETNIPANVATVADYAYNGTKTLEKLYYQATADNTVYIKSAGSSSSSDSRNRRFYYSGINGNGITITVAPNVTRIPQGMFGVGYYDVNYSSISTKPKIKAIIFEEGSECTTICSYAFSYIIGLQELHLPEKITALDFYYVFYYATMSEINKFYFKSANLTTNYTSNPFTTSQEAQIIIGDEVTRIPNYIFNGMTNVTNLRF